MNIDWNPVIHILDELSDGPHSFLELSFMAPHYEQHVFLDSLLFLADRDLVELSEGHEHLLAIPKIEWPQRLREAFGVSADKTALMVQTSIDLTDKGEEILRLLNVGHPTFSG